MNKQGKKQQVACVEATTYTQIFENAQTIREGHRKTVTTLVSGRGTEWLGGRGGRQTYFLFYLFLYFVTFAVSNFLKNV